MAAHTQRFHGQVTAAIRKLVAPIVQTRLKAAAWLSRQARRTSSSLLADTLGSPVVCAALRKSMKDNDARVAHESFVAYVSIATRYRGSWKVVSHSVRALRSSLLLDRVWALGAIAALGTNAELVLVAHSLKDGNAIVRAKACFTIAELLSASTWHSHVVSRQRPVVIRRRASGKTLERALIHLRSALTDEDATVRRSAEKALSTVG